MKLTSIEPQTPDSYSLWLLTIAPAIWAAHLLLCYITAAIWCAKFIPPGGALGSVRTAIAWYTAVALAGITATGWQGVLRHRYPSTRLGTSPSTRLGASGTETTTHDLDSVEDRQSAVGVLYAALAATFFESCR
jgi:hypothetical protein